MSINLLPKKRWNVWNPDNLARIENDETKFRNDQLQQETRKIRNDQENRLERLRAQALQQQRSETSIASASLNSIDASLPGSTHSLSTNLSPSSSQQSSSHHDQHINLFAPPPAASTLPIANNTHSNPSSAHHPTTLTSTSSSLIIQRNQTTILNPSATNPEHEKEEKIREEKTRKQQGIPTDCRLGEGSIELSKNQPWYYTLPPSNTTNMNVTKDTGTETVLYRKDQLRMDPLQKIYREKQQQQHSVTNNTLTVDQGTTTTAVARSGVNSVDVLYATGLSSTNFPRSGSAVSTTPSLSQLLRTPSELPAVSVTASTLMEDKERTNKRRKSKDTDSTSSSSSSSSSNSSSSHRHRKHYHHKRRRHKHHHHHHHGSSSKKHHKSRHHPDHRAEPDRAEKDTSSNHHKVIDTQEISSTATLPIPAIPPSASLSSSTSNIERLRAERLKRETIEANRSQQVLLQAAEQGQYGSVLSTDHRTAAVAAHALLNSVAHQESNSRPAKDYSGKYFPHLKR